MSNLPTYHPGCWLARHGIMEHGDPMPPCEGRLVRVHLVPKQRLKRERTGVDLWDGRLWVWGCGGPMGNAGHHGLFDGSRRLRVPYEALPIETIRLASSLGLGWWIDREYNAVPALNSGAGRRAG